MRVLPALRPLGLLSLLCLTGCLGPVPDAAPQLTTVTVTCAPTSVAIGKSAQCTARALDQKGESFAVERYTWTSSDAALATVDAQGNTTARAVGTLQVSASAVADGVSQSGQAPLTVTPRPETIHSAPITQSETWRAVDNPHVVTVPLLVGGSGEPILTLEAGVVVRFEAGASLLVGSEQPGLLVAEGTSSAPITFTSRAATPQRGDWGGVWLFPTSPSGNRLTNVVIEYAGGVVKFKGEMPFVVSPRGGLVLFRPSDSKGETPSVLIDRLEVRESQVHGIVSSEVDFGVGSRAMNAHHNGQAGLQVTPDNVSSIPTDTVLAANTLDVVLISTGVVSRSQTWPKLELPYQLISTKVGLYAEVVVTGESAPVLTLTPGTEFQMPLVAAFIIGERGKGSLVAVGTQAKPIRFVPAILTPTKRPWSGLHFMAGTGSRVEHVHLTYSGARLFDNLGGGGVNLYRNLVVSVTNTTLQDSYGCGVAKDDSVSTDYTSAEYGNTFLNGSKAAQCRIVL